MASLNVYKDPLEKNLVPWQGDLWLPRQFSASAERGKLAVQLEIEIHGDRPVCIALTVRRRDGAEVTVRDFRTLDLVALVTGAAAGAAVRVEVSAGILGVSPTFGEEITVESKSIRQYGRTAVTDETYRRTAEVYNANPRAPRKAVRDQLHVSERTAARYIDEAKSRGYIDVP